MILVLWVRKYGKEWKSEYYCKNIDAIIFVIDSSDKQMLITDWQSSGRPSIPTAEEILKEILNHKDLQNVPLLIYLNKQDLDNVLDISETTYQLELNKIKDRLCHIQPCSVKDDDRIYDGIDWIYNVIMQQKNE